MPSIVPSGGRLPPGDLGWLRAATVSSICPRTNLEVNRRRKFGPLQTKSIKKHNLEHCTKKLSVPDSLSNGNVKELSGYEEMAAWIHVASNPLFVAKCLRKGPESSHSTRSTEEHISAVPQPLGLRFKMLGLGIPTVSADVHNFMPIQFSFQSFFNLIFHHSITKIQYFAAGWTTQTAEECTYSSCHILLL